MLRAYISIEANNLADIEKGILAAKKELMEGRIIGQKQQENLVYQYSIQNVEEQQAEIERERLRDKYPYPSYKRK